MGDQEWTSKSMLLPQIFETSCKKYKKSTPPEINYNKATAMCMWRNILTPSLLDFET